MTCTDRSSLLALTLGLLSAVGCNNGWQAYRQIEIGKPLPANSLLARKGVLKGGRGVWYNLRSGNLYPDISGDGVGVALDDDGIVTAKLYTAQCFTHMVLFQMGFMRTVLEVQVPESAYHDPPHVRLDDSGGTGDPNSPKKPDNVLAWLMDHRQLPDLEMDVDEDQDHDDDDEGNNLLLLAMAGPFFNMFYSTGMAHFGVGHLHLTPSALSGITREGFDRTYHNQMGGWMRIQNRGNRRIRVESRNGGITDPFGLMAALTLLFYRENAIFSSILRQQTSAIRATPKHPQVYLNRAGTLEGLRQWDRALADYSKAVELGGDDERFRNAHAAAMKRIQEARPSTPKP